MKKALVLSLLLILIGSIFAVGTPRTYYQKVVAGNGSDIRTIVTNTGTTHNANYTMTVDILETAGELLTTANEPAANLRLVKLGTAPNDYVAAYVQLSTFTTPWVAGNTLRWTVTYTGAGPNNGQSTTWDAVIPVGTGVVNIQTPTQNIPPLAIAAPPDPINPVPAAGAMDVPVNTTSLSWTVVHNPANPDPVGYMIYLGTDNPPTNLINGNYQAGGVGTHSFPLPQLQPNTHYFWHVVPVASAPVKGMKVAKVNAVMINRMDATNNAKNGTRQIWDFTTGGAGGTPVQVFSNIPGMDIYRNGVNTGFTTPQTFLEDVGATPTYSVETHPIMTTPPPQPIVVGAAPMVLTFNYTQPPFSDFNQIITLTDGSPITVHFGADIGQWHITVNPPDTITTGRLIFNIMNPPTDEAHGFINVLACIQIWASDTSIMNGTTVEIQYANDAPFQVAIHWAREIEEVPSENWPTWFPAAGGYSFNGYVGAFPLGPAPFGGSSYTDGAPLNTMMIGPLPALATGANALFEACFNNGEGELPVELSSFTAVATAQMFVNLQWVTESETNNLGFNVLRSTQNDPLTAQRVNASIIAGENSETQHTYNFVDVDVVSNTDYYYWLEIVSMSGVSELSGVVTVRVENNNTPIVMPTYTTMSKAYPNPFSAMQRTQLNVDVKANETANVTIYNILGQAVKSWKVQSGSTVLQWDGKDNKGTALGCGVYFAKMTSPSKSMTTKMVIVK